MIIFVNLSSLARATRVAHDPGFDARATCQRVIPTLDICIRSFVIVPRQTVFITRISSANKLLGYCLWLHTQLIFLPRTMPSDDENEDRTGSTRYCSKCGRPTKGHSRPWGPECLQEAAETDEIEEATGQSELMTQPTSLFSPLPAQTQQQADFTLPPSFFGFSTTRPIVSSSMSSSSHQPLPSAWPPPVINTAHPPPPVSYAGFHPPSTIGYNPYTSPGYTPPGAYPPANLPPGDIVVGTAILSNATAASALAGNYADLTLFTDHQPSDQDTFALKNGKLTVSNKRTGRVILSYQTWLKAWANYEELLVTTHPLGSVLYRSCIEYRRFIHDNQLLHNWPAVYSYDTAFRRELSKHHSFQFQQFDVRCFVSTLNTSSLRTDIHRCFRCQSVGHNIQACPFPEGTSLGKTPASEKKTEDTKSQICFNFNAGKCTFAKCFRQHICRSCKGPKPLIHCQCNKDAGQH